MTATDLVTVRDTDEQLASLEAAQRNESHVIDALAGTGKTRQLIRCIERIVQRSSDRRILLLVFGKNARDMIEGRVRAAGFDDKQVKVSTAHALAYPQFGVPNRHRLSSEGEIATVPILAESAVLDRYKPADPIAFATAVVDTLARYCSSAARSIGIEHLPPGGTDDIDAEAILDAANVVWADFAEPSHQLPIWHDVYLKLYALSQPTLKATDLLFDEANDASPVMFSIVMQQKNKGVKIFVGDENQQIFAWRGAIDALKLLDLPRYDLTQSFRFGPNIAEYANRILEMKGARLRLRGVAEDPGRVVISGSEEPNVILARTNLGLFEAAIDLVTKSKSIAVVGSLKTHVKTLLGAYELFSGRATDAPGLSSFKTWTALVTATKSEQGSRLAPYVKLVEKYQRDVPKIAAKLTDNAKPPSKGGVRISTIHGLKGDSDEVVKLWPDFDPFVDKSGKVDVEEANLWYVAMTRPQRVLDLGGLSPLAVQTLGEPKLITMAKEPRAIYADPARVAASAAPREPRLPLEAAPAAEPPGAAAQKPTPAIVTSAKPVTSEPADVQVTSVAAPVAPAAPPRVRDVGDSLADDLASLRGTPPGPPAAAAAPPLARPATPSPPPNRPSPAAVGGPAPTPPSTPRASSERRRPRIAAFPTALNVQPEETWRAARLGARRSVIGWLAPAGADLNLFERWIEDEEPKTGDALPSARVTPVAEPRHLIAADEPVSVLVGKAVWDRYVARAFEFAKGRCDGCGTTSPLEPHVRFALEGIAARIERVGALCERCHRLAHIERYADADLVRDLSAANGESDTFSRVRLAQARKAQALLDRRWYIIVTPDEAAQAVAEREEAPAVADMPFARRLLRIVATIAFS